jgi:hypothetical protein
MIGGETSVLKDSEYHQAINLTKEIAADVGTPQFYLDHRRKVERSQRLFDQSQMVRDCLGIVGGYGDCYGHGFTHIRKVALDAGAIILIEVDSASLMVDPDRLVLLGHLAGLLHDVKRREKDHARQGAQEAAKILVDFDLEEKECSAVTSAIANHEAFQPQDPLDDPADQLISDALYDADKFRWGPDNFTETLWAMLAARSVPLSKVFPRFLSGLDGIGRIRETFRTTTGKTYGPDFIDRGLKIGKRFYLEMTQSAK